MSFQLRSSALMAANGRPWQHAGARGRRYAELPPDIERAIPLWLSSGRVDDGDELKRARVWRVGAWAVKRFAPRSGLARWFRPAPALRCARSCAAIAPVRTPRPLLAFEQADGTSWLVTEFVDGKPLHSALRSDPHALHTLPEFMARMHRHGVIHGDLNVWNLLWDGSEWVLIDLDGLRGPLHRLRARGIADEQWERFAGTLRNTALIRPLYERVLATLGQSASFAERWRVIERRAGERARHYDRVHAAASKPSSAK